MAKIPLKHRPIPPLRLIPSDKEALLELANVFVLATIEDYERHLYCNNGIVDSTEWVQIKQFENVSVYEDRQALKARRLSRVSGSYMSRRNGSPLNLLWSGPIVGDLDDVMYAAIDRTTEEAKVKALYVENNCLDCAILDTIVHATPDDPFRSVQIKWTLNAGPPMMRSIVRCRDFVYLESTGITTTSTGERIGFQLLHSITLPSVPELHEHKVVRGNLTLSHFFRQTRPKVVETYVKAFVDFMGDMPLRIATTLSMSSLVYVWRLGEYAMIKKLNRKLRQRRANLPSKAAKLCHVCAKIIQGNLVRRRTCKICMHQCCAHCCVPKKMFFVPAHTRGVVHQTANVCTSCMQTAAYSNGMDIAQSELTRTTGQIKAYAYWTLASPTLSTLSM